MNRLHILQTDKEIQNTNNQKNYIASAKNKQKISFRKTLNACRAYIELLYRAYIVYTECM